ncbi:MAG: 1-acyl-sn-glycerol-3-phosphate acyltransferase [bacterium]|nr:1-acyl-sn-glycerol-3-phosphate acyltransferase [bacterium]MDE0353192.1 1-acyl-sn-glycerol-3-phosphate acyltransferase [bacterium]
MIPRSARLGVLTGSGFRSDLARIARETGRTDRQAMRAARKYLREIRTIPSPLVAGFGGWAAGKVWRRNYRNVHYDHRDLERLAELGADHPLVFLPSHKSQLDHAVLHHVLWRNGRPPNYTASGINMNFFLVGPILRRSGSFFIRRRIGDRPIYKRVLRAYLAHILEQCHPVEWYIEGTRSRTGKLLPPTYGLLTYAAEAIWNGRCDDIHAIPVSISYDHVEEIEPYVAEQRGATKRRETLIWMVKSILRMGRDYGDIHVRLGEPLSMAELFAGHAEADRRGKVEALGTEICSRINRATPVTATSLVVSAILGDHEPPGLSMARLGELVGELVRDAEARRLPAVDGLATLDRAGIERIAVTLARRGIVTIDRDASGPGGASPTYRIEPDQRLAASFYRNTVAHHYVVPAAAEVALAAAGRATGRSLLDGFHDRLGALHGLLETDFFLPDREAFAGQVAGELARRIPAWETRLLDEGSGPALDRLRPHRAPWALRHFLEAYRVVAGRLAEEPGGRPSDRNGFLRSALERSLAYVRQDRIPAEAASLPLLSAGLRMATRHDPVATDEADLRPDREALAVELGRFLEAIKTLGQ